MEKKNYKPVVTVPLFPNCFKSGQCCEMGLRIAKKCMLWWAQTTEYLLALHTQGAIMSWAIR